MKRKLKSEKGLTLVELLAAVPILILLGLMLNTGMQVAVKGYYNMAARSEVQLLLSTAADAVSDELRYARNVRTDVKADGVKHIFYDSDSYGMEVELVTDAAGQLCAQDAFGSCYRLLPPGAYAGDGYRVEITVDYTGGIFTIGLKIKGESPMAAGDILAETDFCVRSMNM